MKVGDPSVRKACAEIHWLGCVWGPNKWPCELVGGVSPRCQTLFHVRRCRHSTHLPFFLFYFFIFCSTHVKVCNYMDLIHLKEVPSSPPTYIMHVFFNYYHIYPVSGLEIFSNEDLQLLLSTKITIVKISQLGSYDCQWSLLSNDHLFFVFHLFCC